MSGSIAKCRGRRSSAQPITAQKNGSAQGSANHGTEEWQRMGLSRRDSASEDDVATVVLENYTLRELRANAEQLGRLSRSESAITRTRLGQPHATIPSSKWLSCDALQPKQQLLRMSFNPGGRWTRSSGNLDADVGAGKKSEATTSKAAESQKPNKKSLLPTKISEKRADEAASTEMEIEVPPNEDSMAALYQETPDEEERADRLNKYNLIMTRQKLASERILEFWGEQPPVLLQNEWTCFNFTRERKPDVTSDDSLEAIIPVEMEKNKKKSPALNSNQKNECNNCDWCTKAEVLRKEWNDSVIEQSSMKCSPNKENEEPLTRPTDSENKKLKEGDSSKRKSKPKKYPFEVSPKMPKVHIEETKKSVLKSKAEILAEFGLTSSSFLSYDENLQDLGSFQTRENATPRGKKARILISFTPNASVDDNAGKVNFYDKREFFY